MTRRCTTTTVLFFLAVRFFVFVHSQQDRESLCESQQTCQKCLQTPQCVWCSTRDKSAPLLRCVSRETFLRKNHFWCIDSDIVHYENNMTIIENRPFSSVKDNEVQVQPQKIRLRLKRGEEHRMILKYKQAKDYPVDLYYLMDLSASMEPYREQLSKLGLQLARTMQNLTSNFRIGFGSFVDKVILPMTNTQPEGGLEAMMQVMVCTTKIGWRQKARHLIVFSTDAASHIAGDGKLAGVIEPNDCKCHLDDKGVYNYFLEQDYPSISQINRKAREHNMNIIFAVHHGKNITYTDMSSRISGSSVGILKDNSENVIALVRDEYKKLVDTVTLIDNMPKMIDIKYFSRCLKKTGELLERRECEGLRIHNDIEFEIVLKVTECPENPKDWKQTVQIKPRDLNESLTIDVEIICDCACERPGNPGYQPNATECRGSTSVCGVCSCNPDFYGKQCECKVNEVRGGNAISTADCKPNNQTDQICSGHGTCKCGVCECEKRPKHPKELFYGKYCQCDNFSCQRSGGELCGGRGRCDCGICNCDPGWGGEKCDCKESNSTCIPPGPSESVEICSGHGDCICGSCHCHERDNIRYSGEYCEECPTCPGQWCEELKDCVECIVYKTGPLAKDDCDSCLYEIEIGKVVKEDPSDEKEGFRMCRTHGDKGCTFVFKYKYLKNRGDIRMYKIQAQEERSCPTPINALGVALGVVISTVVIGFLNLLIWKILMMIHDKREYAKFEKERALAKWDRSENPLYKPATSTFNNVAYKSTK